MPSRSESEEAIKVADLLDPALGKLGVRPQVHQLRLQRFLSEILGPTLSPLCTAVSLERGALLIATTNSSLSHQLHLDSPRLIQLLNQRLGFRAVKRLRFRGMES